MDLTAAEVAVAKETPVIITVKTVRVLVVAGVNYLQLQVAQSVTPEAVVVELMELVVLAVEMAVAVKVAEALTLRKLEQLTKVVAAVVDRQTQTQISLEQMADQEL